MSQRAERKPAHVDAVARVESGHVLFLCSDDSRELVGQIANDQEAGWRLAGAIGTVLFSDGVMFHATLVRGVPGSPTGVDIEGGEGWAGATV